MTKNLFPNFLCPLFLPPISLLTLLSPDQVADAHTVAGYCRQTVDLTSASLLSGTTPAYAHLPLCVLDAVWSIGVRYEGVQKVVSRYAAHANLSGGENGMEPPPPHTIRAFVQMMEHVGVEPFAVQIVANRQRTASTNGILKAEAVYRFALALNAHDAQTIPDVPARLRGNAVFERAVLAIPGQSSGLSLRYFYMLCGAHDLTKPDRMVFRFLQTALNRSVPDVNEAQLLLSHACTVLQTEFPGLSPRTLGNAIWKFERGGNSASQAASHQRASPVEAAAVSPTVAAPLPVPPPPIVQTTVKPVKPQKEPVPPPPEPKAKDNKAEESKAAGETDPADDEEAASYRVRLREIPADDRPRERLLQYGADVLSIGELLAILLRSGTQQQNVMELANHLLSQHGGLRGVATLTPDELSQINGIGPAKAAQIKAAIEFGRRLVAASPEERAKISSPRDVYHQVGPALRDEKREHFIALLLDTKNGLLRQITISVGDLSSSLVHPREVFAPAIRHSAASLIVAHNHPSGDPTPSPEDVQVTARLVEVGELLGIPLLDHIVVGDMKWASLKEKGLM